MLTQLTIENFGLIDRVELEFDSHLNILTGETGAGKSILIGALRIALGERLQTSQIRDSKKPCLIEAVFDLSQTELTNLDDVQDFFIDGDNTLIIQRQCQTDGRTKIKINGQTVTVNQLRNIGKFLIDFHGPHDHQLLLNSDYHSGMLDRLVKFGKHLTDYQNVYTQYRGLTSQLNELKELAATRDRELDMLTHQVKELEQVSLDEDEYKQTFDEQARINNAEKISDQISQLLSFMGGDQNSTSDRIQKSFSPMRSLNNLDQSTSPLMEELNSFQELNDRLLSELNNYSLGLSFDNNQARVINDRCDIYDDILRKYGPTLEHAQKFYEEARSKLNLLTNLEHNDAELKSELETLTKDLKTKAKKLTALRKKAAQSLNTTIEKELTELGIKHVQFEARVTQNDFHENGYDEVIFYISPNAGEDLKPLSDIVSSGEAARVMLALKKALIKVDPVPVLIFDEIDAQIGGRLGTITGQKLKNISLCRQVILITHLPQIASFADIHFKVSKSVKNKRALTNVAPLNAEEQVKEIATMMSGENETDISIKHATKMLMDAQG